ncbi:hypothetical protein PIB30_084162, partial [Stylosanthes scabra]|nr:hypothetical protein [Stylosanthes scabra]
PNPTGPVLVPDHYRAHFPKDNSLDAPTVYDLSLNHIYLGVSLLYIAYITHVNRDVSPKTSSHPLRPIARYCRKPGC